MKEGHGFGSRIKISGVIEKEKIRNAGDRIETAACKIVIVPGGKDKISETDGEKYNR
jgi:hypothetical protein